MTAVQVTGRLGEYLAEQGDLTAVARFARRHEVAGAVLGGTYRDLVPLDRPGPGEQYAFEVDLDACSGCKACVAACQSLNGLDRGESFRAVGALHGSGYLQTVTAACHHCVEPACLEGCPADAYEKDPTTGVVRHLDDQCIGCSYCTLTCPYEVPRLNRRLGIVRKCDMCAGRLAVGEAPACAQACPNGAIRITTVATADAVAAARTPGATLVPGAPPSALTTPTTRYRTGRTPPADVAPADLHAVAPARGHPPLAWMLVVTQLAVGAFVFDPSARAVAASAATLALAGSVLHLGRPLQAWRAVLGLRHSWLSREIVAFGLFALLALASLVAPAAGSRWVQAAAAAAGGAGVWCSARVYAATGRALWAMPLTLPRFALTAALLGAAAVAAPAPGVAALAAAKVGFDLAVIWPLPRRSPALARTRFLLRHALRRPAHVRLALAAAGVVLAVGGEALPALRVAAAGVLTAGELVERHLFFRAEASARMPGGIR